MSRLVRVDQKIYLVTTLDNIGFAKKAKVVAIVPDARFLLLLVLPEDNVILSHTAGTIKLVKCGGVRMGLSTVVCCWVLYSGGWSGWKEKRGP